MPSVFLQNTSRWLLPELSFSIKSNCLCARVFINKFVRIISRTSHFSCRVEPRVRGRSLPSLNLVHLLIIILFITTRTQYLVCLIPASKNILKFNKKNTKDYIQKRNQSKIAVDLIPLFVIECLFSNLEFVIFCKCCPFLNGYSGTPVNKDQLDWCITSTTFH